MEKDILNILNTISSLPLKSVREIFQSNEFNKELTKQIEQKFDFANQMMIKVVAYKFQKGLILAREGKLDLSAQAFDEGRKMKSLLSTEFEKRVVEITEFTAVSYWYYKNNDFDNAKKLLWMIIRVDEELEQNGFSILLGHRIQQLHNLARINFRMGDFEEGCFIINTVLLYMSKIRVIPFEGRWRIEDLDEGMPVKNRGLMFWQLTSETISFIYLYHPTQFQEYFNLIFQNISGSYPSSLDEEMVKDWVNLKEMYYEKNYVSFLEKILPFAQKIDINYTIYLYSLLVDIEQLYLFQTGNTIDSNIMQKIHLNLKLPAKFQFVSSCLIEA